MLNGHRTLHSSKTKDYMKRVILMDWLQSISYDERLLHLLWSLIFLKRVDRKKTEVTSRTALSTEPLKKTQVDTTPVCTDAQTVQPPPCCSEDGDGVPVCGGGGKSEVPQPTWGQAEGVCSALLLPQTLFMPGDGARCLFRLVSSSAWYKCLPASTKYFLAKLISVGEGAVVDAWSSKCSEITLASSLMKLFYLSCFEIKMGWSFS